MQENIFVTVLINNYNYGQFLQEAVESVLSQSYQHYEIVIVDDGSTDHSREILNTHYSDHDKIEIILKSNGGQLSCFNEGLKAAKGDIIFFLDADDTYKSSYLEEMVDVYDKHPSCGFIFCALEAFGNSHRELFYKRSRHDMDFGITFLQTLVLRSWIGMQTSAISVKKEILEQFLPIPYLNDWITRADDCIVWGASLSGARKFYVAKPLVNYRIHGSNAFAGKKFDHMYAWKREQHISKLFDFFQKKLGYLELSSEHVDIKKLIKIELSSKPDLSLRNVKDYWRIAKKLKMGIGYRLEILLLSLGLMIKKVI